MVFGKKAKAKAKVEEPVEETPDLEVDLEEEAKEIIIKQPKPKVAKVEEPEEIIAEAQVMSGELLDGGIYRYVVIANKSLGEIGDKFPLD